MMPSWYRIYLTYKKSIKRVAVTMTNTGKRFNEDLTSCPAEYRIWKTGTDYQFHPSQHKHVTCSHGAHQTALHLRAGKIGLRYLKKILILSYRSSEKKESGDIGSSTEQSNIFQLVID